MKTTKLNTIKTNNKVAIIKDTEIYPKFYMDSDDKQFTSLRYCCRKP